jgi:tRNA modification GTPase
MSSTETIFALSSGRLPAGIAVIRISGPRTRFAIETIFGDVPEPRAVKVGSFRSDRGIFDHGICLFFPGPGSVTGEDCGEFHLHGGLAVVKTALTMLEGIDGLRMAEPGEFTQRAFLNGKLDLTGAEALSDLISAETERQLEIAGNMGRRQSETFLAWRQEVLAMRALVESALDFSDQEDVPDLETEAIARKSRYLADEFRRSAGRFSQAEIVRTGFKVVLVGAPNAGKSSLLNALALRDVVLVSDEPGTTRDAVSVSLDVGGHKVVLTDTAGLREEAERVEAMGIERARQLVREADLVLRLTDMSNPVTAAVDSGAPVIDVGTKSDLGGFGAGSLITVSSVNGAGLTELLKMIETEAARSLIFNGEVWPTRERHVRHLLAAADCLDRAAALTGGLELIAEEMRAGAVELGRIVGVSDTEELLGEIFGRFCIGK